MKPDNKAAPGVRRKLPIGIQTFREIRESDCYYVDKTAYIRRLVDEGKHYFLSRPRRFGKSLFVDTLKELFEGSEELFEGLAIHERWDWSVRRPVVRFDFARGDFGDPGFLREEVGDQLHTLERRASVAREHDGAPARFAWLIETLHERTGRRVAVLVDEYDKPILDALEKPDVARANRNYLRGLYSCIKSSDAHIEFTFLTGVSRFSRVSLFSGINNLIDLTMDPSFSAVCGYTEADLDTVFAPELPGLDRAEIRAWYNGYNWRGKEKVYNPFDILLLFRHREFSAYWFETGTPTFLVRLLASRGVASPELEGMAAGERLLSAFDADDIGTEALLFQTGYLTIAGEENRGGKRLFRLGYPNREVRQSLNECLLEALVPEASRRLARGGLPLCRVLEAGDLGGLEALLRAFFASIPCEWHTRNEIARYEGYYASVFYSHFAAAGLDVRVEDSTSRGRADMAAVCADRVYLFEFKAVDRAGEAGSALAQLRERGYAEKYRGLDRPIHLVGIEFSRETRNLASFETASA